MSDNKKTWATILGDIKRERIRKQNEISPATFAADQAALDQMISDAKKEDPKP